MTGNTIMLKIKYIILLGRLQQAAINVVLPGSHPCQKGLEC